MKPKVNNQPITGTTDIWGLELRKLDYLFRAFTDVVNLYGYEQLEVPIIEHASSFSEDIVGQSPWPEWDKKGCFYLKLNNYGATYDNLTESIDALLIPEGTIPVTRWLGKYLESNPDIILPLKVFYKLPCFRNELTDSLSGAKRRQFNQFGLEILGSAELASDIEIIYLIHRLLIEVGIDRRQIRVRISNVGIFKKLIDDCKINHQDSIRLKESMDIIAECRAGKKPERQQTNKLKFWAVLETYHLEETKIKIWEVILNHDANFITPQMYSIFTSDYWPFLDELTLLCNKLIENDINSILDLCVVRSHEYYTGISFEVDVITPETKFIEIAGGGRYDKLVGNFVKNYTKTTIPSTGFAFGLERVVAVLDSMLQFDRHVIMDSKISFDESNADTLILLNKENNVVTEYFKAVAMLETKAYHRCDIYMGDSEDIEAYKAQRNIHSVIKTEQM